MYVLGGVVDIFTATDSVLKFDITRATWNEVAPMPEERRRVAACAIGSDIYVFGGDERNGLYRPRASVFKYDTETNEWSTPAPMPLECAFYSVSVLDDLVSIVGAEDDG
jgi:N-acetylneuraminic acid mutarotase